MRGHCKSALGYREGAVKHNASAVHLKKDGWIFLWTLSQMDARNNSNGFSEMFPRVRVTGGRCDAGAGD